MNKYELFGIKWKLTPQGVKWDWNYVCTTFCSKSVAIICTIYPITCICVYDNFVLQWNHIMLQSEMAINGYRVHKSYWYCPWQKHRAVHLSAAFTHLHCLVHSFLKPQCLLYFEFLGEHTFKISVSMCNPPNFSTKWSSPKLVGHVHCLASAYNDWSKARTETWQGWGAEQQL